MTTTTMTRGSDWGIFANHGVFANWGDCGDGADVDATYKLLGELVVKRFHEIATEHGSRAYWTPYTSEVTAPVDEQDFPYDEWREQAHAAIWERWGNGEIEPIKAAPDYCTQNDGDCSCCSLVNYGRDCMNNPV